MKSYSLKLTINSLVTNETMDREIWAAKFWDWRVSESLSYNRFYQRFHSLVHFRTKHWNLVLSGRNKPVGYDVIELYSYRALSMSPCPYPNSKLCESNDFLVFIGAWKARSNWTVEWVWWDWRRCTVGRCTRCRLSWPCRWFTRHSGS